MSDISFNDLPGRLRTITRSAADTATRLGGRENDKLLARIARITEIVLLLLLAYVFAKIALTLFSPLPVPKDVTIAASGRGGGVDSVTPIDPGNPFGTSAGPALEIVDTGPDLEETRLNLKLHGTWADGEGGGSALIQRSDGQQKSFAIGTEIENGVVLDSVYAEQVVIRRAGVRESLSMENRDPSSRPAGLGANAAPNAAPNPAPNPGPNSSTTAAAPARAIAPAERIADEPGAPPPTQSVTRGASDFGVPIGDVLVASPEFTAQGMRVRLRPGADRAKFKEVGLQPGDILLSLNGRTLSGDLASEFKELSSLANSAKVNLTVQRGAEQVALEIALQGAK